MTSRSKRNGKTSARRVEKAREKLGCSMESFFFDAACIENTRRELEGVELLSSKDPEEFKAYVTREVREFRSFNEYGLTKNPWYEIPSWIMKHVERQLCRNCSVRKKPQHKYGISWRMARL